MSIFSNIKVAFQDKSDRDLNRAYWLFKSINNPITSKILTNLVKLAIKLKLPINSIIKKTIYKQFCGGTTIENSQETINKLWKYRIGTILDFSAEAKKAEDDFNSVMEETIKSIHTASFQDSIPFAVFKMTGITKFNLLEKMSSSHPLSSSEKEEKEGLIKRIENICSVAKKYKVPLYIDAEESWIQPAIDGIVVNMMKKYNKQDTIIFNTLQMYRKDRLNYLHKILEDSNQDDYLLGIKIVRGAYHEQEIKRSKELKYPCPVYTKKSDTDKDYNTALEVCIKNIDQISLCAGTHNEESCELLIQLLKKHNISRNDNRIYFSQLLGMSDHISYNAAKAEFNVTKYVPYGPIKEVIPYLIRRAEENTSMTGQMGRELANIIKEKNRRKKIKNIR